MKITRILLLGTLMCAIAFSCQKVANISPVTDVGKHSELISSHPEKSGKIGNSHKEDFNRTLTRALRKVYKDAYKKAWIKQKAKEGLVVLAAQAPDTIPVPDPIPIEQILEELTEESSHAAFEGCMTSASAYLYSTYQVDASQNLVADDPRLMIAAIVGSTCEIAMNLGVQIEYVEDTTCAQYGQFIITSTPTNSGPDAKDCLKHALAMAGFTAGSEVIDVIKSVGAAATRSAISKALISSGAAWVVAAYAAFTFMDCMDWNLNVTEWTWGQ